MLADIINPSTELLAVIMACATAIQTMFTYLLHRQSVAHAQANSDAIVDVSNGVRTVHALAVNPTSDNKAAAADAVSNLPKL